jgi:phospholipid/cholesterol/gamma-HCH transport system substrate-binding protein
VNLRRRNQRNFLSSPVLVGALTVLAMIVGVNLAYQANNGLPFVPRYTLHVQIADASELTRGGEVHEGGALVGNVQTITATRDSAGNPIAMLNLKLDKKVEPLSVDTTFDVRLKGSIGLKYLAITPGHSHQTWRDGATIPESHSSTEVDLDQVLSMFTPPTRVAVQQSTGGFATALAGRGNDINDAIGAFVPLVRDLGPVAQNLSAPRTGLGDFFRGLERYTGGLAPVAATQAQLFGNLDTTFTALASVAYPYIQNWIAETPPTFSTVIADSPALQSFLSDTAGLFGQLRPGFATLPQSAPVLADAFAAGAKNLPGTPELNRQTLSLATRLNTFGHTEAVNAGLNRIGLTLSRLKAPLAFLTPVQTTCNYLTLFLRNTASSLSEKILSGTALRINTVVIDDVPGGEGTPSSKPYLTPASGANPEHGALHANPYPYTASPGQPDECAAGNEPYTNTATIGNPPGPLSAHTETTKRSLK